MNRATKVQRVNHTQSRLWLSWRAPSVWAKRAIDAAKARFFACRRKGGGS